MPLDQIPTRHRDIVLQIADKNIRCFADHIFPLGTRRRQNFDLFLKGGSIIAKCGWPTFFIKLASFLSSKESGMKPTKLSIVAPIYDESCEEILRISYLTNANLLEIVILNYKKDLNINNEFKSMKRDASLSFSEALNDATLACSGGNILFLSRGSSLTEEKLFSYLLKVIRHNFSIIAIDNLSSVLERIPLLSSLDINTTKRINSRVPIQKMKPVFLSSDIFLAKKDWIVRFGGFDDQFISEPYMNNNLKFSASNLLYKLDVLTEAAYIFNANPYTLRCLKRSRNSVYECEIKGEKRILRILERSPAKADQVRCEIDWINYLTDRGVPAPRALPSINGNRVEIIKRANSSFLISNFTKASGHNIDTSNDKEWNDMLFQKWGRTMGKMHHLTKDYKTTNLSIKRNDWNAGRFFKGGLDFPPEEDKVVKLWRDLLDELYLLPKDNECYGLVHNDMHYNNILTSGSQLTVIDFDGCAYNWFACDIAIALYEALWTAPYSERNNFAKRLIKNFFLGYNQENYLDYCWIELLPKFLKFREIYAYLIFMKDWNHDTLTFSQKNVLSVRKRLIEMGTPCIEISLDSIAHADL